MRTTGLQTAQRIALVAAVALMVACSWLAPLESAANQQVDAGLKRALVSFATARVLNAIISVAQGTQVAFEPGGIGVNLAPGQALDPVNDLVETFSNLALAASVAFGIEKVLISISAYWLVSLLFTMTAIGWAYFYLHHQSFSWLTRILMVLLLIRFVMPIVFIGSGMLFDQFMAKDYQTSQQTIDMASGQLDKLKLPVAAAPEDQGMLDKFKGWASKHTDDLKVRFVNLKQAVEQVVEHFIMLMVIFLLQALVLPLLLLWILWGVARGVLEVPPQAFRFATPSKHDEK